MADLAAELGGVSVAPAPPCTALQRGAFIVASRGAERKYRDADRVRTRSLRPVEIEPWCFSPACRNCGLSPASHAIEGYLLQAYRFVVTFFRRV